MSTTHKGVHLHEEKRRKEHMNKTTFNVIIHHPLKYAGNDAVIQRMTKKQADRFNKELAAEKKHIALCTAVKSLLYKLADGGLTRSEKALLKKLLSNSVSKGSGKMDGINSISTSAANNRRCAKNALIPGSICQSCYAMRYLSFRPALRRKLELNTILYTTIVLPLEYLPTLNDLYFRFESFGDLNNAVQVVNYWNIAHKNTNTSFAHWTKNPDIIQDAIDYYGLEKPSNLIVVYSSLMKNAAVQNIRQRWSFVDKTFTVYTADFIKDNDVVINCGSRHCLSCLNCYTDNDIEHISEKLK